MECWLLVEETAGGKGEVEFVISFRKQTGEGFLVIWAKRLGYKKSRMICTTVVEHTIVKLLGICFSVLVGESLFIFRTYDAFYPEYIRAFQLRSKMYNLGN